MPKRKKVNFIGKTKFIYLVDKYMSTTIYEFKMNCPIC